MDAKPEAAPGAVVRAMVKEAPPPAPLPEVAKSAAPAKAQAPKLDQTITFSPTNTITVNGDVKDPAQLARELEPYNRAQCERFLRETAGRQVATPLFDDPHL